MVVAGKVKILFYSHREKISKYLSASRFSDALNVAIYVHEDRGETVVILNPIILCFSSLLTKS